MEHTETEPLVVEATPVDTENASKLQSLPSDASEGDPKNPSQKKMVASGATGAVVGFLFGGPILSALLGFGAAYVSQRQGKDGDAARALGDFGVSVKNKAAEIDQEHKVVERTSKAAKGAWDGAQKYDQRHNILEKSRGFAIDTWKSFVNFVQEKRVLQQGVDGFGKGYEYVAEKVTKK
eukprot:Nitzschia sp. Nitz4//scaffold165_size50357//19069//19605//NITZ4_007020-RA/size50357-processed-gene-0.57-mRNA-1//-1//CDS//3329538129//498//frame0